MDTTLTVEEQIDRLFVELAEIREMLNKITVLTTRTDQTATDAKTIIEKVGAEVMPTINALTSSPMLKMLLPKGPK